MADYIDEFLNGSTKATKTYTIEEYLKEFVGAGDFIDITTIDSGCYCIADNFKRYIRTLDTEILNSELKKWNVKALPNTSHALLHFLYIV